MPARAISVCIFLLVCVTFCPLWADSPTWMTIFDEEFADNPHQRFKILPVRVPVPGTTSSEGSVRYDEQRHAYSLAGRMSLVRPVRAGAHVELDLMLRFLPPTERSPTHLNTELGLVLHDRSVVGFQVRRTKKDDDPTTVRLLERKPGQVEPTVLQEVEMLGPAPDGGWQLRYRHGLLTLVKDTKTVGSAYIERLGIQVAGVSWLQMSGEVSCDRMILKGKPLHEISPTDQSILKRASRLNEESKQLLRQKKADAALEKMRESSALFVKVHGDNHHDSANSFANLASILASRGNTDEAGRLWARALAIHENALGPTHPHTTLTRFNLGKHFMSKGDKSKAKELWTRCRDDLKAVHGPDYKLVRSLDSILLEP